MLLSLPQLPSSLDCLASLFKATLTAVQNSAISQWITKLVHHTERKNLITSLCLMLARALLKILFFVVHMRVFNTTLIISFLVKLYRTTGSNTSSEFLSDNVYKCLCKHQSFLVDHCSWLFDMMKLPISTIAFICCWCSKQCHVIGTLPLLSQAVQNLKAIMLPLKIAVFHNKSTYWKKNKNK